jgi:hypothetical protein
MVKAKNTNSLNSLQSDLEPFEKLLQAMRSDPLINKKVIVLLKMGSYPRRLVLSSWLEKLGHQNAPKKLTQALSCLFDNEIAEKTLNLINKPK